MDGSNDTLQQANSNDEYLSVVMSEGDLKGLGLGDVAYIKAYNVKGRVAYVLHAADGSTIDVEDCEDDVFMSAYSNDLNVVALH